MKKIYFLIILCSIIAQSIMAQTILQEKLTISRRNGTLKEVLAAMSKENNITFSYASNIIDDSRTIKIPKNYRSLNEILSHIFEKSNIKYKVNERRIILYYKKSESNNTTIESSFFQVKGRIIDKKNDIPLPYVAIQLKKELNGGSCNEDGIFDLKFHKKHIGDSLIFSSLGYVKEVIAIKDILKRKDVVVKMTEFFIPLKEVKVKPKPALDLVKEAVAAIPKNYPQKKYQFEAFYRNLVQKNGKYVRLTEAACNFQSADYKGEVNKYERQKHYFHVRLKSGGIPWGYEGGHGGFADLYDSHVASNDLMEIIECRKSKDHSKALITKYTTGGPLTCLATDKVKLRTDFLNPLKYKYYKYSYIGITSYDGNEVYVVSFRPKRIQFKIKGKDYRKKVWKYNIKNAEMHGKLYIDTRSLAFVRINYHLTPKKWKNANETTVNYRLINKKWYLWEVKKSIMAKTKALKKSKKTIDYKTTSKLMVSSIDTNGIITIDSSKYTPYSNGYSLYLDEHQYNPEFWHNYNKLEPSRDEIKIITDLEKNSTLDEQFKKAGKYDSTLQTPYAYEFMNYDTIHGDIIKDPYLWMEERGGDKTIDYLVEQNIYANNYAFQYKNIRGEIKQNSYKWFQPDRIMNEYSKGKYTYYEKQGADDEYSKIFRRSKNNSNEEMIFDLNKFAKTMKTFFWGGYEISSSGNKMIIYYNTTGADDFITQFVDLQKGEILSDSLINTIPICWNQNEDNAFYILLDSLMTIDKIYKHKLGNKQSDDSIIYKIDRKGYDLNSWLSRDEKFIILYPVSYLDNEVKLYDIEADKIIDIFPLKENQFIVPKVVGNKIYGCIESSNGNYIIKQGIRGDIKSRDTIYSTGNTFIEYFEVIGDNLITLELNDAKYSLKIVDLKKGKSKILSKKGHLASYKIINSDTTQKSFCYSENYLGGYKLYKYTFNTGRSKLIKESFKPKKFKDSDYTIKQIEIKARDGELIPITLIYHKKTISKKMVPVPMLMNAYGCYGISLNPTISKSEYHLLDKGWIIAKAHVRGGRENGSNWFPKGNLENKLTTYTDVVDCAQCLINMNYTSSEQLAMYVASAGGVIGGYIVNNHPELFSAIQIDVPVTSLIKSLRSNIAIDNAHHKIHGNPLVFEDYQRIRKYSPLSTISAGKYPSILITCGYNDSRVEYWQASKYAAHLQKNNTGNNPVLLKTFMNSGHGNPSGRNASSEQVSLKLGFLIYEIERKLKKANKNKEGILKVEN